MRIWIISLLVAGVSACTPQSEVATPAAAPVPELVALAAVHAADPATYELSWATEPAAPVRIEATTDPDADSGQVISEAASGATLAWTAPDATQRWYFIVTPENGKPERTAPRVLPLEGGRNFRDLGGYETATGETVRWGKVFRSGVMNDLTAGDYAYISHLGIDVLCDLRTAEERAREPTVWQAGPVTEITFPDPAAGDLNAFAEVFAKPGVTPDDVTELMTGFYREILDQQGPAYREMFTRLTAGDIPLAFNCSAGKDRTGVGAALILAALGVPEPAIIADYTLSDKVVDYRAAMDLDTAEPDEGGAYSYLRQMPAELVAPLLKSDAAYIQTALDNAKQKHGSVLVYVQNEYGVSDSEIEALRAGLLE